jgi:hypothetical protein
MGFLAVVTGRHCKKLAANSVNFTGILIALVASLENFISQIMVLTAEGQGINKSPTRAE